MKKVMGSNCTNWPAGSSEKPCVEVGMGAPEAGGALSVESAGGGVTPEDCGPDEWVGGGCPGSRVGLGWWAAVGPEVRAQSTACTFRCPPFGDDQN